MRVAIVLNTSWNIYNFRLGLIDALLANGHEVIAIAPFDEFTQKLINRGCKYEKVTMDSRGANPIKDIGLTVELFRIYRRVQPDVILHFTIKPNIYGTFASRLLNIPSINNVCGLGTVFLKKGLVSVIAKKMYKIAFKYPAKVLFQNQQDESLFINEHIIDPDKTDLVPGSGINLEKFVPADYPDNKEFTFLLISRLIHDKGIVEFVEAIKQLKEKGIKARYQVLGSIDEKHKRGIQSSIIESWIKNDLIEYLGRVDDVRDYIKTADCVVLPSYREGTPRTLLEAAGMARPIVATDVAGCNNIVKHDQNGYLCKLKDADDLSDKMEKMLKLPKLQRASFGKTGRKLVEKKFDESRVIGKYLDLIDAI